MFKSEYPGRIGRAEELAASFGARAVAARRHPCVNSEHPAAGLEANRLALLFWRADRLFGRLQARGFAALAAAA